ncbi:MAG: choice-of-anchor B family protein [Gemmatimonadota bacterium]
MPRRAWIALVAVLALACSDPTGADDEEPDPGPDINDPVPHANGIYYPESCAEPPSSIELVGHLELPESLTDLWAYYDEETGREYALAGYNTGIAEGGVYVIDVTDPADPTLSATLDEAGVNDVVVWMNYAYTVSGHEEHGDLGIIYDLSDPAAPVVVDSFPSGHNLFITERGYMYKAEEGVQAFDLVPDPTDPEPIWTDARDSGHDVAVIGDTLLDFHAFDGTILYDISDPFDPVEGLTLDDDSVRFHHSGWLSGDGRYLYIHDELPMNLNQNADISIWDLDTGERVGSYRDTTSTVHNGYELCDRLAVSYYTRGFVLFDISDPTELVPLDEYDTDPDAEGEGFFLGAWGVYPYTRSGNVLVSDVEKGLYVFRLE